MTGTGALIRLILRRDRVRLPVWFGLAVLLVIGVASSVSGAYPTEAAREALRDATADDPTQLFAIGPIYDASVAGIAAWRPRGQAALLLAVASFLLVIRHTRAEEESGRRELLGSAVVGRQAPLTAALVVAFLANLLAGLVIGAGLTGLGFAVGGSFATGLSMAAAGWTFSAVAAVAAQLTEGARAAIGLSTVVLAVLYVVRGLADLGSSDWLSWLSPFGWTQHVRPFAGDHWWPLLLVLGLCGVLGAAAYTLSNRRDFGAGLLPARPGPATAGPRLRTSFGLAWRLHRGVLLAWTVGLLLFGAGLGAAAQTIAKQLEESPTLRDMVERVGDGTARPVDGFFALIIYLTSQVVTIYAIQATLRPYAEEQSSRIELLLSGPVDRLRWAAGHLALAALGSAIVLAALGVGIGVAYGASDGTGLGELPGLLAATLVRLPAVLVLAAVAALMYGFAPRPAAVVAYAALGLCFVLEFAVELFDASPSILKISPYAQTPGLPVAEFSSAPVVSLIAIALLLGGLGLFGLRRRDLQS
ncbi:ABC transporter permease [Kribbella sp. NPDC020789]